MVVFSLPRGTWMKSNLNCYQCVQKDTSQPQKLPRHRDLSSRLPLLATQGSLVFREVLMLTSHRVDKY